MVEGLHFGGLRIESFVVLFPDDVVLLVSSGDDLEFALQ